MKKKKKWILVKPYKAYIAFGLLIITLFAYLISLMPIYERNAIIHIVIGLFMKNIITLIIVALLFFTLFIVENQLAKKVSPDEEGGDAT